MYKKRLATKYFILALMINISAYAQNTTEAIADPFYRMDKSLSPLSDDVKENEETVKVVGTTTGKLKIQTIPLQYANAEQLANILSVNNRVLFSETGILQADKRNNTLILQDDDLHLKQLVNLVKQLDKPAKQIAIEARIVTINNESLSELGVRWGILDPGAQHKAITGKLEANGVENLANHLNVNFTGLSDAAAIALQIAKIKGRLLDLELRALERENNVEIIATPHLLTTNQQPASIKQGTELPYIITEPKSDRQSVEFREAVLGLQVTPQILADEQVLLDLNITQNSPGNNISYGNGQLTTIDKQEINTQVMVKNGETVVLGGVFHDLVGNGVNKVPLLGDIPFLRSLFRSKLKQHQRRELVIFVTPRVIEPKLKSADNFF